MAGSTMPGSWLHDADLQGALHTAHKKRAKPAAVLFLSFQSLGIVMGDIATSPLYTWESIFASAKPTHSAIMGSFSLIFWTLTLVVIFKYLAVVLNANDRGEGGTFALYSLLCRHIGMHPHGQTTMSLGDQRQLERVESSLHGRQRPLKHWLAIPGAPLRRWFRSNLCAQRSLLITTIIATSMVLGDGILTPAISVLAAVTGLSTAASISQEQIVGITIAILALVFLVQSDGTDRMSLVFAPIILLWLLANACIGVYSLTTYGTEVVQALNPVWIYRFFLYEGRTGWTMLAGTMLCVTGAEAMFADIGHFNLPAVNIAFCAVVYPCLVLTYLGQSAYLLVHPGEAQHAFYASIPRPVLWPMLILAALAAVTASQGLISGCFTIVRQAMTLGVFPPLRTSQTGKAQEGQVYIPEVNYTLMVLCIAVVAGFKNTIALADAYGVAVMSVMLMTTSLVTLVMLVVWELPVYIVVPFWLVFSLIEGAYLSASMYKVPEGGWFALAVTVVVSSIMLIWWAGSARAKELMNQRRVQVEDLFIVVEEDEAASGSPSQGAVDGSSGTQHVVNDDKTQTVSIPSINLAHNNSGHQSVLGAASCGQHRLNYTEHDSSSMRRRRLAAIDLHALQAGMPNTARTSGQLSDRGSGDAANHIQGMHTGSADVRRGRASMELTRAATANQMRQRHTISSPQTHELTATMTTAAARAQAVNSTSRLNTAMPGTAAGEQDSQGRDQCKVAPQRTLTLEDFLLATPPRKLSANGAAFAPRISAIGSRPVSINGGLGRVALAPGGLQVQHLQHHMQSGVPTVVEDEGVAAGFEQGQPARFKVCLGGPATSKLTLLRGLGIYYSDSPVGVPAVMLHFLQHVQALHAVSIFLTIRVLPLPTLTIAERLLVKELPGVPNLYMVVARFGYMEQVDQGEEFVKLMCQKIVQALSGEDGSPADTAADNDVEEEDLEEAVTGLQAPRRTPTPATNQEMRGHRPSTNGGSYHSKLTTTSTATCAASNAGFNPVYLTSHTTNPKSAGSSGQNAAVPISSQKSFVPLKAAHPMDSPSVFIMHGSGKSGASAVLAMEEGSSPPPPPASTAGIMPPPHTAPAAAPPAPPPPTTKLATPLSAAALTPPTCAAQQQMGCPDMHGAVPLVASTAPHPMNRTAPTTSESKNTLSTNLQAGLVDDIERLSVEDDDRGSRQSTGGLLAAMPRTSFRRISKVDPQLVQATQTRLAAAAEPSAVPADQLDPLSAFLDAYHTGVVYYLGKSVIRTAPANNFFTELLYGHLYRILVINSFDKSDAWRIPEDRLIELGMCMHM